MFRTKSLQLFGDPTGRSLSLLILGSLLIVPVLFASDAFGQMGSAPIALPPSTASAMQQPGASSNPLLGSVSSEKPSATPISLTLTGAIDRGLKFNLGVLLSEQGNRAAAGARLSALSRLLPNLDAHYTQSAQQINLAAYGFPTPAGSSPIIGPFGVADIRASVTDNVLDFSALNGLRAAREEGKRQLARAEHGADALRKFLPACRQRCFGPIGRSRPQNPASRW